MHSFISQGYHAVQSKAIISQHLPCTQSWSGGEEYKHKKQCNEVLLLENRGGLSLTSLRVMLMVAVPARPPSCPPMSLAWMRTWYCSFTSRSMLGKAVLITPIGGPVQPGMGEQDNRPGKRWALMSWSIRHFLLGSSNVQITCLLEAHLERPCSKTHINGTQAKSEIGVISQTGNTWHSIPNFSAGCVMIHLRIWDLEIRVKIEGSNSRVNEELGDFIKRAQSFSTFTPRLYTIICKECHIWSLPPKMLTSGSMQSNMLFCRVSSCLMMRS